MKSLRSIALALPMLALAGVSPSFADGEVKAGDLVISHAWSRATPAGAKVAGGYAVIENKGTSADKLVGGSADVASSVEVHEMSMNNGVMTMRPLEGGLAIAPGQSAKLVPGGYHLMLLGLKDGLKQGDKVTVTLEFEKAGKVAVPFEVGAVGAKGPNHQSHSHGAGDKKH